MSWTGTGANASLGHNLNSSPEFIIVKNRSTSADWPVYHSAAGSSIRSYLDLDVASSGGTNWNGTTPTSSVFSVGTNSDTNGAGNNMIAYCFSPVNSYSSIGSYEGNGNVDGPVIFTGFTPRWIIIKNIDNGGGLYSWWIFDTARDTHNVAGKVLTANSQGNESSPRVARYFV